MGRRIDLSGKVFGKLKVIELSHSHDGNLYWSCLCECGKESIVAGHALKRVNGTKSCGCLSRELHSIPDDLKGKKFGKLTVKEFVETRNRNAYWLCECSCGNEKVISSCSLKTGHTKSCGCIFKETMKGSNNPAWKGGITPEYRKARKIPNYLAWRKSVFQRDNYTCQKCKKRGTTLHAHHIRSFASNPKLRTDLNNGICLCEHCHLSFHQRYGKLDNNKRQLNSFMKLKI